MFVSYKGLKIIVSDSAMQELFMESKRLLDAVEILEAGYDAPRKRKRDTIEKWLAKGKKTYNVVVVKNYSITLKEERWVLVHFGKFTRK